MQHPPCGCHMCGHDKPHEYPITHDCAPKHDCCKPPKPCPPMDCCCEPTCCKPPKPPRPPKPCPPMDCCCEPTCCEPPKPCPPPCAPCHPPRPKTCAKPMKKPKTEGVLLQKIIACERRSIPCLTTELTLEGLPSCAEPPYTLMMVQQSGAQPWWTPLDNQGIGQRLHLRICIPVCCLVCDACGKQYHATGIIEVEASFRPPCPMSDCWRHSIFVVPCVRLLSSECCSMDCTFQVQLQITLEIYLLRPEPCLMHKPEPPCPELPLYPQPNPPCWPQCPADPDPCGWPRRG